MILLITQHSLFNSLACSSLILPEVSHHLSLETIGPGSTLAFLPSWPLPVLQVAFPHKRMSHQDLGSEHLRWPLLGNSPNQLHVVSIAPRTVLPCLRMVMVHELLLPLPLHTIQIMRPQFSQYRAQQTRDKFYGTSLPYNPYSSSTQDHPHRSDVTGLSGHSTSSALAVPAADVDGLDAALLATETASSASTQPVFEAAAQPVGNSKWHPQAYSLPAPAATCSK